MLRMQPYLLRAFFDWIVDNGWTPLIVVDASDPALDVPREHVRDGRIVLNVAPRAVRNLQIENELTTFDTRFQGVPRRISIPTASVLAIYAEETGQAFPFPPEAEIPSEVAEEPATVDAKPPHKAPKAAEKPEPEPPKGPRGLRVVK